ncbi:MAG: MotA/TolQ/ExbB proton channel family protein [Pyrinomonadaceae bacterium]|nr:MotA/TolQ/ExbB proton channel family protein [Pyrinomonadaceae bacterium]
MNSTPQAINKQSPAGVSIFARLVPVLSYLAPLAGAALSVLLIVRTFQAMRNAETAGIAAVGIGISEANLPVLVGLYFAIFLGVIGIIVIVVRCFMSTTTASPSAWFFLVAGALGLIPLVLLWEAESLLIQAISPGYNGGRLQWWHLHDGIDHSTIPDPNANYRRDVRADLASSFLSAFAFRPER